MYVLPNVMRLLAIAFANPTPDGSSQQRPNLKISF